jgi:hypothetical protein
LIENATKMYLNNDLVTDIHFPPLVLGEPVAEISIPCGVLADGCFDADVIEHKFFLPSSIPWNSIKTTTKKDALVSKGSEEVVTCLVTEEPN